MKRFFTILAALSCGLSLLAQDPLSGGVCGMYAYRLDGKQIYACQPMQRLVPASCTKLMTTGTALITLGENFRFKTTLAHSGTRIGDTINGDLYIIGGADPDIDNDVTFVKWKHLLDSLGVKKINGRVIGDGRFLPGRGYHGSWQNDDLNSDYSALTSGLNFCKNRYKLSLAGGTGYGDSCTPSGIFPEAPWLKINYSVYTGAAECKDSIQVTSTELAPIVEISGTVPYGKAAATVYFSNSHSALSCAYNFRRYLLENGVSVTQGWAEETTPLAIWLVKTTVLGVFNSRPLIDIINDCNRHSDNFYAETLLRTMGQVKRGSATYETSCEVRNEVLKSLGLNMNEAELVDGCGLSRKNMVSPMFIVNFLIAMSKHEKYEFFLQSLPRPGEGTLKYFYPNGTDSFKSRIRMKSGSMRGIRCLSGYILPSDGKPEHTIVFSILTNNMMASSRQIDRQLEKNIESWAAEN